MSGNCHECRLSLGTIHVIGALEIELLILTQKLPYRYETDFECFSTLYILYSIERRCPKSQNCPESQNLFLNCSTSCVPCTKHDAA